jgi:hypothetical protein
VFLSYFAVVSVLSKDKNKMLIYDEKQNLPLEKKTWKGRHPLWSAAGHLTWGPLRFRVTVKKVRDREIGICMKHWSPYSNFPPQQSWESKLVGLEWKSEPVSEIVHERGQINPRIIILINYSPSYICTNRTKKSVRPQWVVHAHIRFSLRFRQNTMWFFRFFFPQLFKVIIILFKILLCSW